MAALDHAKHVADGRAGRRRDDADASGKDRHRLLVIEGEQTLFIEPLLELFERELKRADSFGFYIVDDKLVLAARLVQAHPAPADDLDAVLQRELEETLGRAEKDGPDLALLVLQGEVGVT
jgi:hypothetical protein